MDYILSPWIWATAEFLSFYRYFFSLNYAGRTLMVIGLTFPIIAYMRLKGIINKQIAKNKLIKDLKPIVEKSSTLYSRGISKDSEKYNAVLAILNNNAVVPEATKLLFQDDSLLMSCYSLQPGVFIDDLRMQVLKDLIISFHRNR